jgi:hypothetical protein
MEADDLAALAHDPEVLATAIVAVATSRTAPVAPAFATALAAADSDTVSRIHRLLLPDGTLSHSRRRLFRVAIAAFALTPVLVALTPAAIAASEPPLRLSPVTAVQHPVVQPASSISLPTRR